MSNQAHCLDSFARWLLALPADALTLAAALDAEVTRPPQSARSVDDLAANQQARLLLAGALNYLFKSLDLIQDGIEDLGYIDDCFVLRVAAARALPHLAVQQGGIAQLAEDADVIQEFLGDEDYQRLLRYGSGIAQLKVRGRSTDEVVLHEDVRASFLAEIKGWASSYQAPSFSRDQNTLLRLRSFLATKLPQ